MKKIFISQRVEIISDINERRDALSQEWSALAEACGFLPVPVPNRAETVREMLRDIPPDGIILSGGNDLAAYGGNAPERDETEIMLTEYALKTGVPLLGVCRGAQLLLHYFGARLEKVSGHVRTTHILDSGQEVNSFHSWAAKDCPEPLLPTARSADGCTEEFTHRDAPHIKGVMWHPERYSPLRKDDINMIKEFFGL